MDRRRFVLGATALPLALTVDPLAVAARLKGAPLALVTADLESHVVVLDLETTRVVARIRTGPGPRAIEHVASRFGQLVGRRVLVAHTAHGVVTLIGSESLSVASELDGFEAPRYTCSPTTARVGARTALAYVTDSAAEQVVTVDVLGRGKVLWRTGVPGPARHISVSPEGSVIWAALGNTAERIAVLEAANPRRPKLARTISPPFRAHDIVFAPDGRHVWVTSGDERRVAVYRAGARRPVRVVDADAAPQHVAFGRAHAFVASGEDGTVRRHRLDGDLVREDRVPYGSYNVAFGGGRVVTPSLGQGTVSLLDPAGRVLSVRRVARAAHDACVLV